MLAFEHFHQGPFQQYSFDQDVPLKDKLYQSMNMDSYPVYNNIPFSFYEPQSLLAEAPQDFKYEMNRTASQSSYQPRHTDMPPALLSSGSGASIPSPSSSTVGSPYSGPFHTAPQHDMYPASTTHFLAGPAIVCDDAFPHDFATAHFEPDNSFIHDSKIAGSFVDPVLLSGHRDAFLNTTTYPYTSAVQSTHYSPAPSPAPSTHSYHSFNQPMTLESFGVIEQQQQQQQRSSHHQGRRPSISSQRSSASPHNSFSGDEDSKEKGRCPYPDCGRVFKDLKAHMLTHESERPEKCPILSCEYNKKGFARKYDKNRHTLTHYKGTMVCGFCPGSGSAAEKSFNRADVFKRHLTSVHGVEQTPPNSRKRSPSKSHVKLSSYCQDATGKCSTCSATFENAQEFYEHLDDCVLKVVQQEEPSEAINAQRLGEVCNDINVQDTFERNHIKSEESLHSMDEYDEEEDDDEEEEEEEDDEEEMSYNERSGRGVIKGHKSSNSRPIIGGNISKKSTKKGMTWSRGGGAIVGKSRKRRKFYPPSWGMATDKMNMKKRVLCVYDGPRRLLKDDMMMHNEFEVRMPLADGNNYVTDLDVETLKRAEAFHNATPEEKGPWIQEQDFLQEFMDN